MLAKSSLQSLNLGKFPNPGGKVLRFRPSFHNFYSSSALQSSCNRLFGYSSRLITKWPKRSMPVIPLTHIRTPVGAPTASHLTDDNENNERYNISGGNDIDSLISSSDVPTADCNIGSGTSAVEVASSASGSIIPNASVSFNDSPKVHSPRLAPSFGRLKHQRIKALFNKSSSMKQKIKQQASGGYVSSDMALCTTSTLSNLKSIRGTKTDNTLKDEGSVPIATKSLEHMRRIKSSKPSEVDRKIADSYVRASRSSANIEAMQKIEYREVEHVKNGKMRSFDSEFFSKKTFMELGCSESMIGSLKGQLLLRPSNIQALAFRCVVEGKSCIIADQSGSGKTLAYLAPIVQRLRQTEEQGIAKSYPKKPRVVILAPTAELASQVLNDCRLISKFGVPFRSMVATGGFRQKTQFEILEQGVDVLIATPGRFIFLVKEGVLDFTNLQCAVLDEIDILFKEEDFKSVLQQLISSSPVSTQYVFVTATLPKEVYNKLVKDFPDCEVISGPGVHCTSPRLEEVLVDCSGDGRERTQETAFANKKSALLQLAAKSPVSKTIVFCNKIETCRKVENALKRFDRKGNAMRILPFHAALESESRLANLREFLDSRSRGHLFLVCTDRASRGIDFAGVDHVVLFDFPRDPSEYVRRVGRTARGASGKGTAFVFVVGRQVSLAQRIVERNRKGHPLHDVPFVDHFMFN